jgi:tRNA1Val (adenine37-N6)-methyltransferase
MSIFKFKHFEVDQSNSAMKIGTDSMVFGSLIDVEGKSNALDIGTGTGVLSLMTAQRNPSLKITAIEIEADAFDEAKINFDNSSFKPQLTAFHVDFLNFSPDSKFDLIFSNPPYFENASKSSSLQKNLARHDDSLPLNVLFEKVAVHLTENGLFWVILPNLTFDTYSEFASKIGLHLVKQIEIFGKENQLVRKIGAFSKINKSLDYSRLIIRKNDGNYTDEYKELTIDYHFNVLK